jgi:hypothetical protein
LQDLSIDETYRPEVFLGVRNIPQAHDAVVTAWIKANSSRLMPAYLYELAGRLWRHDQQQAFEWYAVGSVRARYDALRCLDPTAGQGILVLPRLAEDVAKAVETRRAEFGEAGLRAMTRADLFADAVSPIWICLHGIGALNQAIQGRPTQQSDLVKPPGEWPEIRERLRTQYARYFEEQGKPQEDPFPLAARRPPYIELGQGVGRGDDFAWADTTTLVFFTSEKGIDGKPTRRLRSWSPSAGVKTGDAYAGFGGLCAGSGRVMIRTRGERRDGQPVLFYEDGTLAERTPKEITIAPLPQWPLAAQTGATTWSVDKSALKLDRFGCRWVDNVAAAAGTPGNLWLPLAQGDGLLRWRASGPGGGALEWLADEQRPPLPLPLQAGQVPLQAVQYLAANSAYFISPIWRGREKEPKESCAALVWLYPKTGRVEKNCAPDDALSGSVMTFAPAPGGIIRIVSQRQTFHGPKPGGLYLTDAAGKTTKIFESHINATQLSPDGCRLAFAHSPERAMATSIGVLDLCATAQAR